ncbi:damage-control phosphatase ARMT1-like isoform X2 [Watersipora subatra]
MTDKPLTRLEDNLPDSKLWNSFLDELYKCEDSPRWFLTPWLYIECLMYRQIVSALHQSKLLSIFDPFAGGKKASWKNSEDAIHSVLGFLNKQTCSPPADIENVKSLVRQFLELSLWGNKCDLSISSGQDNSQTSNPLKQIGQLDEFLLVDDYECLWSQLLQLREKHGGCNSVRIDIILDNAGFELLSDLCLAEVLLTVGMASQIMFHIKSYPWFVSDTTEDDVKYCLSKLQQSDMMLERCQGNAWAARVNEGSFVFRKDEYWTLPHDYAAMREKCPKLYTLLSDSDLLIFKGDLNYRKLLGDREWPCEATFDEALLAFNPAPMLSLRTLKAELCVGLEIGMMEKLTKQDKEWMVSGKYAVIQFTDTVLPLHLPSKADSSGDSRQKVAIQSTVTVIE